MQRTPDTDPPDDVAIETDPDPVPGRVRVVIWSATEDEIAKARAAGIRIVPKSDAERAKPSTRRARVWARIRRAARWLWVGAES